MDEPDPGAAALVAPLRSFLRFLRSEAAGGTLLILASLAALAWANSPAAPTYRHILQLQLGPGGFGLPVARLVNDGLMSLFFLLAGLEIRHEMTEGELASVRGMAAPGIAALGGMVVPALIYVAINHADPATLRGWAIPVATDIAFSLAVLRVLGQGASLSLKIFLTALAILDDLGAILVIALFYTNDLRWPMLAGALATWLALLALRALRVRSIAPYLAGGAVLWLLLYNSGIHATLAGVALAFVVPARARAGDRAPVAHRLQASLSGVVAYLILPVFGLANAGLDLRTLHPAILLTPAPLGVFLGLVLGKQIGVFGATLLGRALGLLRLPHGMGVGDLYGAAVLCGIGFTMSLFIGDLAFRGTLLNEGVKLAVLCASLVSACCGLSVLSFRNKPPDRTA